ncbi:MAG TPA: sigma factor-like helix-turn-helix DNA-binding protein [Candidatus Paceibacterota bacterium]
MVKEIRLEIKPRNNLVLTKMEEAGIKTVAELCRKFHLGQSPVGDLINMKASPLLKGSTPDTPIWRRAVTTLARRFKCLPEDLFPESIVELQATPRFHLEVSIGDLKMMGGRVPTALEVNASPEFALVKKRVEDSVYRMLETLTPREEKVIKLRFGFDGEDEHTLEEVAGLLAVKRERVRMIEAKALRRLRHPSRSVTLKPLADELAIFSSR